MARNIASVTVGIMNCAIAWLRSGGKKRILKTLVFAFALVVLGYFIWSALVRTDHEGHAIAHNNYLNVVYLSWRFPAHVRSEKALRAAAQQDHYAMFRLLIVLGANPNPTGRSGHRLIVAAAEGRGHSVIEWLIKHSTDINVGSGRAAGRAAGPPRKEGPNGCSQDTRGFAISPCNRA